MTLLDFYAHHAVTRMEGRGMSPGTIKCYRFAAAALPGNIKRIGPEHIEATMGRAVRSGTAKATVNTRLAAWRSMFRMAVRAGIIQRNPCEGVDSLKMPVRLPRSVNGHMKMLAACKSDRDRAAFALTALVGLRSAEALSVLATDFRDGFVTVIGKGDKERRIPVSDLAATLLEPALSRGGRVLRGVSPDTLRRIVRGLAFRANLPKTVPHQLRHCFGTAAARGGAHTDEIQQAMGHANPRTTQLYTKAAARNLRGVVDAAARET